MGHKDLIAISDIVHDIVERDGFSNCVISGITDVERTQFVDNLVWLLGHREVILTDTENIHQADRYKIVQLKYDLAHTNFHVLKAVFHEQNPLSLIDELLKLLGLESQLPNSYDSIVSCVDSILCKSRNERIIFIVDDIQRFYESEKELQQFQNLITLLMGKVYIICINQHVECFYERYDSYIDCLNKIFYHSHDFRHLHI